MSRIGLAPIEVPAGIEITISDKNVVSVKGPKGELHQNVDSNITVKKEENSIVLERHSDQKDHKAKHGLYRSLINNMVEGVNNGFKKDLELVGVGYRASNRGQILELSLGFSHPIVMDIAPEVKVTTASERGKNPIITLESFDKQLIGQVAAKIK